MDCPNPQKRRRLHLESALLSVLACPQDRGPLYYCTADARLYNPRLGCAYEIADGIPVLLAQAALPLSDDEAAQLDERIRAGRLTPTFDDRATR